MANIDRVIITGGCGFIGGHLAGHLADQGYHVTVIDDKRIGKYVHKDKNIQYRLYDVVKWCDVTNFSADNTGMAIIHLANTPRVRRALDYPSEAIINNISTTAAIAEKAAKLGVPLYFAQSSSILYADKYSNAYTWSKAACDEILEMFALNIGLQYTNMYFYNVYGPGEADYGPYSTVIRKFKQKYLAGESLEIYGTGKKTRDFTHVHDVVQGIAQMLVDERFDHAGASVHLGKGEPKAILDIAESFTDQYVHTFDMPGEAQDTLCKEPYIECPNDVFQYITDWKKRNDNTRN